MVLTVNRKASRFALEIALTSLPVVPELTPRLQLSALLLNASQVLSVLDSTDADSLLTIISLFHDLRVFVLAFDDEKGMHDITRQYEVLRHPVPQLHTYRFVYAVSRGKRVTQWLGVDPTTLERTGMSFLYELSHDVAESQACFEEKIGPGLPDHGVCVLDYFSNQTCS